MKKIKMLILAGCLISILCGCGLGKEEVDTTTVSFGKDGKITQTIVEDFSQSYYDAEELRSDIESEIAEYTSKSGNEKAVVLDSVELDEDKVIHVELEFAGYTDYKTFNERDLFCGTVADAYAAGYEFTSMRDVMQENVVLSAADVLEKGDMHMVVLEEAQQMVLPGKIRYISDGVSVVSEKRAVNLNEGQKAFLIYE